MVCKVSTEKYNGTSLYDHKKVDATLELDACLTGFGCVVEILCTICQSREVSGIEP